MADARLTHPTRGTLPFHQRQSDESSIQAVASIANELGVDRRSLVHTETREGERSIRGRVTGRRRAANDPDTDDWVQALANYVGELEAHVDEFQGDGYTLEDDLLDIQKQGILEKIEWERNPGQPFDLQYEATFTVGQGTMGAEPITDLSPTVNDGMDVLLRIDGVDLPGFRDLRVSKSVGIEPKGVFDRDSAENNDIVMTEGVQRSLVFEGTHTGTASARATASNTLENLVATKDSVTLETRFPGYSIEGFVNAYGPTQESRFGDEMNHYRVEFVEGTRA